jgi:MFS family permease
VGDEYSNSISSPLWFNPRLNRGLSDFNVGQNLEISYTWEIGSPKWASRKAAMAERFGRKRTLAIYFTGMMLCIMLCFGWAFYLPNGLRTFMELLFLLGFFGGNFAMFTLWLPEQYGTSLRTTAFAFATSFGRFFCAGLNFVVGALVRNTGTLGKPVALTAVAFAVGLLLIPFADETRGHSLPE